MATQYPLGLDNLINPTSTDRLDSATVPHHRQHENVNDAIEAIQTVIGLAPAGSHLTVKDRIVSLESNVSNISVLNGLTDVTISTVAVGEVLRYNGSQWINYAESNLVDGGNF